MAHGRQQPSNCLNNLNLKDRLLVWNFRKSFLRDPDKVKVGMAVAVETTGNPDCPNADPKIIEPINRFWGDLHADRGLPREYGAATHGLVIEPLRGSKDNQDFLVETIVGKDRKR